MPDRKLSLTAILMWASLTAHPQVLTETFDGIPDDLSWHIRVHTAKTKSTELTVYWNYADSADNTRAIFRTIPRSQTDDRLGGEVTYSIMRSDSVLSGGRFMSDYALASDCGFSVVLGYSSRGARLQAGGRGSEMAVEVPYSQEGKQTVGYTTSEKVIRNDVRISCKPAPEYAPFSSVEDLDQYLRMSNDRMEGLWQYLDRNLDADRMRLGGNYRMATVADGQGGYLIIYLSGARYGQESWKPLRVKGRLHPTVFADHYDLEWLDSAGRVLEQETNATVTTSGTILELHFPLEGSSLRFSRQDRRGE